MADIYCKNTMINSNSKVDGGEVEHRNGAASGASIRKETVAAPDGGYGWVVCVAFAATNFSITAPLFTFSVLYLEYVDYFQVSIATIAWLGAGLTFVSQLVTAKCIIL